MTRRNLVSAASVACCGWTHGVDPRVPLNSSIVYFGDSITAFDDYNGYKQLTGIVSGARYYTGPDFDQGVSGNTTAAMLARISTVLALTPTVVVVEGGINDGFNNGAVTNPNLTSIYTQLLNAGIIVVAVTELPNVSNVDPALVNNFIRAYPGIHVADMTPGFDNPTMCQSDHIHPNTVGALFMGNVLAPVIQALIKPDSILSFTTGNLFPNTAMTGSVAVTAKPGNIAGTGVVPTGFRLYQGGPVATTVSGAKTGPNEVTVTVVNANSADAFIFLDYPAITAAGNIGDLFDGWCEVDIQAASTLYAVQLTVANSQLFGSQGAAGSNVQITSPGVYRTIPAALSGSQTTTDWTAFIYVGIGGSATVRFASPIFRKVP